MDGLKRVCNVRDVCLAMSLSVALLLMIGSPTSAADSQSTTHQYKMWSALEYSGETQFRSETETVLTVHKEVMSTGKVRYVLSPNGLNSGQGSLSRELSFVIDRKTQHLSGIDSNLSLMEKVTNQCVGSVTEVTKNNIGKTWKQNFDLQFLGGSGPRELNFTLTAIPLETETYGELVAVRALSEPFFVETDGGSVQCRMNCTYVFGSDFEDIILSASVFNATTNFNGFSERLKHMVATWKVDASGHPANVTELNNNKAFAKLTSKLGMSDSLKVTKPAPLPQWAQSDGVRAAQVANLCAAVSCEGALNPVATIYMPVASTLGLQSVSESLTTSTLMTAAAGAEGAAGSASELKWWPPWANIGWNVPTAAWGAGLGVGGAALGGAFDGNGNHHRSPAAP